MLPDKLRQFGVYHFTRRSLLSLIRPIWDVETFDLFVIPNFRGHVFKNSKLRVIDSTVYRDLCDSGKLTSLEIEQFRTFLDEGSQGLAYEQDGCVAGVAWLQTRGVYRLGRAGLMQVPEHFAVMKNLLVRSEFRGGGVGRILNQGRLSMVPAGVTPLVFIVHDNRPAIRNWEAYGFQKAAIVKQAAFAGAVRAPKIRELMNTREVETLVTALRESQ